MSEENTNKKERFIISGTLKVSRQLVQSLVLTYLSEQENVKPLFEKLEKDHGNIGFWWTNPNSEATLPSGESLGMEVVFGKEGMLSEGDVKEQKLYSIDKEGYFLCPVPEEEKLIITGSI